MLHGSQLASAALSLPLQEELDMALGEVEAGSELGERRSMVVVKLKE